MEESESFLRNQSILLQGRWTILSKQYVSATPNLLLRIYGHSVFAHIDNRNR